MRGRRCSPTVERVSWMRIVYVALSVSALAFVVGLVVEGLWGGTAGETNWVDQSFGFAMWAGGAFTMLFSIVLVASLVVAGVFRLIGGRRATGPHREGE
jgi:uncharacterized membrane protein